MKTKDIIKGKVSVIIPAYNCENYIEKCIESILNQTYKNLEIIICDDCSTDSSYEILEKIQQKNNKIILLKNEKNSKAAYTRNRCIEEATGEYIAIQDADDFSDKTRIEKQVEILDKEPNIHMVSTGMYVPGDNDKWVEKIPQKEYPNKEDFLWNLPFFHGTTLFRTETILKVDGYTESKDLQRGEDFDLFFKLYINNFYGKNLLEPLYYYTEDINAYKRRSFKFRISEAKLRYKSYKQMKLMPIGLIYSLKPIIVGLIPRKLQYLIKKRRK